MGVSQSHRRGERDQIEEAGIEDADRIVRDVTGGEEVDSRRSDEKEETRIEDANRRERHVSGGEEVDGKGRTALDFYTDQGLMKILKYKTANRQCEIPSPKIIDLTVNVFDQSPQTLMEFTECFCLKSGAYYFYQNLEEIDPKTELYWSASGGSFVVLSTLEKGMRRRYRFVSNLIEDTTRYVIDEYILSDCSVKGPYTLCRFFEEVESALPKQIVYDTASGDDCRTWCTTDSQTNRLMDILIDWDNNLPISPPCPTEIVNIKYNDIFGQTPHTITDYYQPTRDRLLEEDAWFFFQVETERFIEQQVAFGIGCWKQLLIFDVKKDGEALGTCRFLKYYEFERYAITPSDESWLVDEFRADPKFFNKEPSCKEKHVLIKIYMRKKSKCSATDIGSQNSSTSTEDDELETDEDREKRAMRRSLREADSRKLPNPSDIDLIMKHLLPTLKDNDQDEFISCREVFMEDLSEIQNYHSHFQNGVKYCYQRDVDGWWAADRILPDGMGTWSEDCVVDIIRDGDIIGWKKVHYFWVPIYDEDGVLVAVDIPGWMMDEFRIHCDLYPNPVEEEVTLCKIYLSFDEYQKRTLTEDQIGALPVRSMEENDGDHQCSVCHRTMKIEDLLMRLLPCQHEFHSTCISTWLKKNASCPICRRDVYT